MDARLNGDRSARLARVASAQEPVQFRPYPFLPSPTKGTMKTYREIASLLDAIENCKTHGNSEWEAKNSERLQTLVRDMLPHGGGFDNGTTLDLERSNGERLVFHTAFHHMNDGGYYDGWTEHTVTVRPSFRGFDLKISGRNRKDIKDYIYQTFDFVLHQEPRPAVVASTV